MRTFNNGDQVGVIDLQNNLAGSGNSMGPITLEARLAGSINPPPYAQSNIDYKSINGTNISGIGTAADFSLVAPSQTIDLAPGASLSGTNISLIATAGDVTVKSAITNAQVNGGQSGGSLNLYATGNIVLDNPGGGSAGVVIGKDLGTLDTLGNREYEKFDHTLTLVATGDIRIYGTVEVTGDLALRANASAAEASGPGGVAGFGAGAGSVIIAGSAGNPVEVRANNIIVGTKDASGNPLPVQNLIIDNSANTAGSGQFFDTVLRAEQESRHLPQWRPRRPRNLGQYRHYRRKRHGNLHRHRRRGDQELGPGGDPGDVHHHPRRQGRDAGNGWIRIRKPSTRCCPIPPTAAASP